MVNAHGDLKVFFCAIIRRYEDACVVDQDVQGRPAVQKLVGEVANGPVGDIEYRNVSGDYLLSGMHLADDQYVGYST